MVFQEIDSRLSVKGKPAAAQKVQKTYVMIVPKTLHTSTDTPRRHVGLSEAITCIAVGILNNN